MKSFEELKKEKDEKEQEEKDKRRIDAIVNIQKVIVEIYDEQELKSLAGPKMEFLVNGRQVLAWFFDVVRKGQIKFKNVNFHEAFDDLVSCSDEIMHFTAQLYLYLPYLNNPIEEGYPFYGRMIYPNNQNLAAKRFGMYSNSLFEKLYNFWDRIGDLIAVYLPEKFKSGKVYFGTAVDAIPEEFHSSENYKWLKEFKEGTYKQMNEKRIDVVHYINNDTTFKHKHIEAVHDKDAMQKLISERDDLPDYFKEQINLTLAGFEKTILLLQEITDARLKDIK